MKVEIGPYLDYSRKVNKRKKRIVKVTIDKYDSWNLDQTLALIIAPALAKFDKGFGIPASMFPPPKMCGEADRSKTKTKAYKTIERAAQKKWDDTLEQMRWSFDQIARNEPDAPEFPYTLDLKKINAPRTADQKRKLKKYATRRAVYHEKIKHGLELFGKHFQDLWN